MYLPVIVLRYEDFPRFAIVLSPPFILKLSLLDEMATGFTYSMDIQVLGIPNLPHRVGLDDFRFPETCCRQGRDSSVTLYQRRLWNLRN